MSAGSRARPDYSSYDAATTKLPEKKQLRKMSSGRARLDTHLSIKWDELLLLLVY
jgi:hypothetical protein